MRLLLKLLKDKKGFIAIVALGMLGMLSVVGIIVQRTTSTTSDNLIAVNRYYEARDVADSVSEYLEDVLSEKEAGFNFDLGETHCGQGTYIDEDGNEVEYDYPEQGTPCAEVLDQLGLPEDMDIDIEMRIKGRADESEYFLNCIGLLDLCYITPFPATGDAGKNCQIYKPFEEGAFDAGEFMVGPTGKIEPNGYIPQIDYACNWNRLYFGNSTTDRIRIPLYYDESMPGTTSYVVNPFYQNTGGKFALRMRPPCKPCVIDVDGNYYYEDSYVTCSPNWNPTACTDDNRYQLETQEDDKIVVKWRINATCEDGPCSIVEDLGSINIDSTAFYESKINGEFVIYRTIISDLLGKGIKTDETQSKIYIKEFLQSAEKPSLDLFLSEKLTSVDGRNIPYLEYQLLTSFPVASPKVETEAVINIDGSIFTKTLYKDEQNELIDFAVQS